MRSTALKVSVASILAIAAAQAHAQTTAAPAEAAAADTDGLQDIVVTAQRFTETAQRTALVIEAIGSEQLKGISDVRQLQSVSPGVTLAAAGNVTQTFVRGVGSLNATNYQESAIAYNADGVFLFTSTMISPLMYDLERVEILKGPQGTLYGRNASGGAVNLIFNGARLGRTEGYVEGEIGNYDLRRITGAVNLPLSENLAVRFAGQHAEHDGYLSDGTDDQDVTAGRVRLRWEPSSAVTVTLGGDIAKTDAVGAGTSINPNPTSDKFVGALDPRVNTVPIQQGGTRILSDDPNPPPFFKNDQWAVHGQIDADLGFATLTVLPAYRHEEIDSLSYIPGYSYSENTTSKQKSLEVRLANRSDALKWVLGAYYFKVNQDILVNVRNNLNFQDIVTTNPASVKSYAFFGEGTYSVTDAFRLIGGVRYTNEKNRLAGFTNARIGPPGIINPVTGLPNVQTPAFNPFNPVTNPGGELLDYPVNKVAKADAITWKVGLEYDLAPDSLIFLTASRGFKGGGNYSDIPTVDSSFAPEFLTAFEFGSRNRFLDNTLQVNLEAFYWKLKDQQVAYVGFNSAGQINYLTQNAGKANMYGGSIDITWRPTPANNFRFAVEYVKSEYDSFVRDVPIFTVLPSTRCDVTPTPVAGRVLLDCSGKPLLRTPKWSGTAAYTHTFELGGESKLDATVDMTFGSGRYLDAVYTDLHYQGWYELFNASLSYDVNENFNLTAWVRNIGNTRVETGGGQFFDFYSRPTLLPPRTVGVSARLGF